MGFDIRGPERSVCASNIDVGPPPFYDLLSLPREFDLDCPELEKLSQRFYCSTTVCFATGQVQALCDEVLMVMRTYMEKRQPELIQEHAIRAKNSEVRRQIVDTVFREDKVYRMLAEFSLLCDEAIAMKSDVQCQGD